MKKGRENKIDGYKLGITTAIFLFLFVGPLITFKPAYDYTIVKNIIGYLFCLVLSAVFIVQKKKFEFEMKNLLFFTVFALWTLFSSLTAPFGAGAAKEMENYILYFLIFLFAMNITLKKSDVYIWLSSGAIASLIALFNFLGPRKYVVSTFGNPNFFAGHLMMLIAIALSILFMKIDRKERYLLILFLVISSVSVISTRSRAAISASIFGAATVMFLVHYRGLFIKKWGGYIVFFLAVILSYPRIHHWIMTDIRFYIWRGALNLIGEKPFTGWGLGNFVFFYPYYRIREYFLQDAATPVTTQVHNEYLHICSDTGIIGLLLFLGVLVIVIVNALRKSSWYSPLTLILSPKGRGEKKEIISPKGRGKKRDCFVASLLAMTRGGNLAMTRGGDLAMTRGNTRNDKGQGKGNDRKVGGKTEGEKWEDIFIKGCIAGIVAVLVDNVFSTNLRNPSTAMYFWFLLGLCAGYVRIKETDFQVSRVFWYAAGTVAFIMCVFTSFYRIMPQVYLKKGIWARESSNMREAIDNYQVVCSVNPHNYEAFYKMAFAYGGAGRLQEAKKVYLTINKYIFPHFAKTDANLGTVYLREGDIQNALYYYRWAEWFNPYDIDVLCGSASIYLTLYNNIPEAVTYLNRVLTIDPKNGYANRVMGLLKKEGKI
jgi:O-antigen ligase